MATTVKCVWMFRDASGTGWQEVHYWNSSTDAPNLQDRLSSMVDVIAPARALILGLDCAVIGARASYPRPGAVASLSKSCWYPGNPEQSGCSQALSLAGTWSDSSTTRQKVTHLRGFWDNVETNGEYHPEGGAAYNWEPKLEAWKQTMIAGGYGWPSKDAATSASGQVLSFSELPSGHVEFVLGDAGMPQATVGKTVTVRISRLNSGKSVLNGEMLVTVTSTNLLTSVKQIATGPFTGRGKFLYRSTMFVPYFQMHSLKLGRRQQGRPFGQLPGRSATRARY